MFAAYEVVISCSAAFLGEISLCQLQLNILGILGVTAITYYAIFLPPITTIAHLLAGVYHTTPCFHYIISYCGHLQRLIVIKNGFELICQDSTKIILVLVFVGMVLGLVLFTAEKMSDAIMTVCQRKDG